RWFESSRHSQFFSSSAMATMQSRAPMPDPEPVEFQSDTVNFAIRAVPSQVLEAAALVRGRKRLRPPKERLPVGEEVDVALVQNAPSGGEELPAPPPPAASPIPSPAPAITFE